MIHPDIKAMTIATLGLIDDEQIPLDLAALALSELDHPGADLSEHGRLLQQISDRLRQVGGETAIAHEQAEILAGVIHGEFGFAGDVATYDAPLNGDFIRVLDRRRGLPVSLSILYTAAARRVGWRAVPLNTPGHVLVRVGEVDPVIIDPFNGGVIVRPDQLLALLDRAAEAGVDVSDDRTGAMDNRTTLVRLLVNQATRAEAAGDLGRAMTIYQRMTLIAPENTDGWWSLARLQLGAGMIEPARVSLSAMLEVTRDPEHRHLITATLEKIAAT
jgi:regulator of sirC expression with transglutaminase-like and TPR domain